MNVHLTSSSMYLKCQVSHETRIPLLLGIAIQDTGLGEENPDEAQARSCQAGERRILYDAVTAQSSQTPSARTPDAASPQEIRDVLARASNWTAMACVDGMG